MLKNPLQLLFTRRFLPLFLTQFFGAFNDNAFKLAVLTLITFQLVGSEDVAESYQALGAATFILPFFLFSATAGQLADKYDKANLSILIKFIEVLLMLVGAVGMFTHHISLMMITILGMGIHSTFFGPIKYALLPEQLKKEELIAGNGLIEASTFIAILAGTLVGTLCSGALSPVLGVSVIASITISCAILGFLASLYIPKASSKAPTLIISFNIFKASFSILKGSFKHRTLAFAILGISWFWFIGATFLTELPVYTKFILGYDSLVFCLFLTLFSVGIALGSLLVNRLLKGRVSLRFIPLMLLLLSVFSFDLFLASPQMLKHHRLYSLAVFLSEVQNWRIIADVLGLAISGGIFIVPLYALLQLKSKENYRSRVIAANNIVNAFFMVLSALLIALLNALGMAIIDIYWLLALLNLGFCLFAWLRLIKLENNRG